MRNWNGFRGSIECAVLVVFTVPMRNWNRTFDKWTEPDTFCFYSTYEELKLTYIFILSRSIIAFLQYLWGIETAKYSTEKKEYTEFLQYLWGIETGIAKKYYGNGNQCFYSTYEELKHQFRYHVVKFFNMFLQYLWGIETRGGESPPCKGYGVFTVPMRNWNSSRIKYSDFKSFVFTVPMRNWNIVTTPIEPVDSPGFYSTYEELKHIL